MSSKSQIGLVALTALVISSMIGSGIFSLPDATHEIYSYLGKINYLVICFTICNPITKIKQQMR